MGSAAARSLEVEITRKHKPPFNTGPERRGFLEFLINETAKRYFIWSNRIVWAVVRKNWFSGLV